MILLGIAAFFQMVLLPGLLLSRAIGIRGGVIRTITLSFVLSMILNYHMVLLLTLAGCYTRGVLLSVFVLELLTACYLFRQSLLGRMSGIVSAVRMKCLLLYEVVMQDRLHSRFSGDLLAGLVVVIFFGNFFLSMGQVFDHWDDVVSWNRWALDWYNGQLPTLTWHYPQLLPANWSISYLFINDGRIQFFANAVCALFPLLCILLLVDLWLAKKSRSYLYAIPSLGLILVVFAGDYLSTGYADIPVAFMSLMAVCQLVWPCESESDKNKIIAAFLGTLCCVAGGLTKQSGLYLAGVYPLLCYLLVIRSTDLAPKYKSLVVAGQYVILLILVAPWYVYSEVSISKGSNISEISHVTDGMYADHSMVGRALNVAGVLIHEAYVNAIELTGVGVEKQLVAVAVTPLLLLLLYALCCSISGRFSKYLLLMIVAPYFLIWCLFFSYDVRNLTPIFGLMALCVGYGIEWNIRRFGRQCVHGIEAALESGSSDVIFGSHTLSTARFWMILVPVAGILSALAYFIDDSRLVQRQLYLQRHMFESETNRALYDLTWNNPNERVITDYQIMKHLPGLESRCVVVDMNDEKEFFRSLVQASPKYICFVAGSGAPRVMGHIVSALNMGNYSFVAKVNGRVLVRVF